MKFFDVSRSLSLISLTSYFFISSETLDRLGKPDAKFQFLVLNDKANMSLPKLSINVKRRKFEKCSDCTKSS